MAPLLHDVRLVTPILLAGVVVVVLASLSYTVALVLEQRTRRIGRGVLAFLTFGVAFDASATLCMILGSEGTPFTPHGMLGYSALSVMLAEAAFAWRQRARAGERMVSPRFHGFTRAAYAFWILAFVSGVAVAAGSRAAAREAARAKAPALRAGASEAAPRGASQGAP